MLFELLRSSFCFVFESKLFLEGVNDISAELGCIPSSKHTRVDSFPAAIRESNVGTSFDVSVIFVPRAQEFRESFMQHTGGVVEFSALPDGASCGRILESCSLLITHSKDRVVVFLLHLLSR